MKKLFEIKLKKTTTTTGKKTKNSKSLTLKSKFKKQLPYLNRVSKIRNCPSGQIAFSISYLCSLIKPCCAKVASQ